MTVYIAAWTLEPEVESGFVDHLLVSLRDDLKGL